MLLVHQLAGISSQLGHRYASATGLNATDLDALLIIWQTHLEGASITSSQLASQLDLTPAAVSYLVDRLDKSGHIQRTRDAEDRRRVLLQPSAAGSRVGDGFMKPLGAGLKTLFADRSDADLALFCAMLDQLITNIPASHSRTENPS